MEPGQQYAVARVVAYALFVVGLMVGVQSAGVNLNSLLVLGGTLGIGVGFGLQNIANNFVSGLILLAEQPIRVGDRVEVGVALNRHRTVGQLSCAGNICSQNVTSGKITHIVIAIT